ncbi:MAG: HupE/UreJ family protein [Planktotalea sp.]|uniref:HupE/UreJ family protein n=1 Tax=Planktotalea sp. TaxID=2029877 RepID=UPI003C775D21
MIAFSKFRVMLVQMLAVSSILMITLSPARAHEVSPTVGDLSYESGKATLSLRITLESFLAGIDLDTAENTNDVAEADDYDALRALDAATLEARVQAFAPQMLRDLVLSVDGAALPLAISALEIPEVGDVELPRLSVLTLTGAAPEDAGTMQVAWPATYGTLILRQMGPENAYTGYISGGQSSPVIPVDGGPARGFLSVFAEYIPVGFDHILPKGLDHILFVLGLFFFSTALRPLLIQVTSFTLAHTVTLALGALGVVSIPGAIVEPIIAASIVYVAVENIFSRKMHAWRPAIIFVFGLLHGLGFASVLGEFGLPSDQFIAALIGFNVGVEFGQLTVIALAFLAVGFWFGGKDWYRARIAIPASIVIALVGAYWFVERVFL